MHVPKPQSHKDKAAKVGAGSRRQNLRFTLVASETVCTERTPRSTISSSSARSPSCEGRRRDAVSDRDAQNSHSLREATRFVRDGATDESTQNCERNAKTETTVSPDAPRTRAARACRSAASSAHTAPGARRAGAARALGPPPTTPQVAEGHPPDAPPAPADEQGARGALAGYSARTAQAQIPHLRAHGGGVAAAPARGSPHSALRRGSSAGCGQIRRGSPPRGAARPRRSRWQRACKGAGMSRPRRRWTAR